MSYRSAYFITSEEKSGKGQAQYLVYGIKRPERGKCLTRMSEENAVGKIRAELQAGMNLAKCRQCGCMNDALHSVGEALELPTGQDLATLRADIAHWQQAMAPLKYACLGCAYCFPAVATNLLNQAFPEAIQGQSLSCAFEVRAATWPPVPGEYIALCDGGSCPVAVSTLASTELAEQLASARPKELCIVGKTETENIGIDKVIKNTITNPTIRFLVLTGQDPQGHQPGKTLYALWENGVDENMRVIGSPGKRPVLKNVSRTEVDAFRQQVGVVDLIGCDDVDIITTRLSELAQEPVSTCGCSTRTGTSAIPVEVATPVIQAKAPTAIQLDKAGYFVILTQPERQVIRVEHYNYDNSQLRVIEGANARSLYWTLIENGWVTLLSHAAYLGKELTRAELSLRTGAAFIQDGA